MTDDFFKLRLLLSCLRITCRYFQGDRTECSLSDDYISKEGEEPEWHMACNCDGDINKCDLPDKFQVCL